MSGFGVIHRQDALDIYLSTDDEGGDGSLQHTKRSAVQMAKEEALIRAQLARAKKLAQKRMDRHEERESERVFAVLDNVSEREAAQLHGSRRTSQPKFDPALNPYIDHEALEVGDSDSDLAHDDDDKDNDTFIASESSTITVSTAVDTNNKIDRECRRNRKQNARQGWSRPCHEVTVAFNYEEDSDDGSSQEGGTLYEDFVASREAVEAQIDAAMKRKRYQVCDSSDEERTSLRSHSKMAKNTKSKRCQSRDSSEDENSTLSRRNRDDGSGVDTEVEEEASFSSVLGLVP